MDVVKRGTEYVKKAWGNLTGPQRVILIIAALAIVPLLLWAAYGVAGEDMVRFAGSELKGDERKAVLEKLRASGRKFEERGTDIYVPRQDRERLLMDVQTDLGDVSLRKLLESSNPFESRWDKEKKYQWALQTHIERMLRKMDPVQNASVVITPQAESSRFGSATPKASATVQVELKPNRELTRENVNALARLVAGSVPGLDPGQIQVLDTRGRVHKVSASPDTETSAALSGEEAEMEDRIRRKIERLYPQARVAVDALAQPSQLRKSTKTYGKGAIVRESERRKKVNQDSPTPSRIKGEGAAGAPESPPEPSRNESESELNIEYKPDETSVEEITPAGQIRKVTIGVLIPVDYENEKEIEMARQQKPEIESLVRQAAGTRVDENGITVMLVPTRRPVPPPAPTFGEKALALAEEYAGSVGLFTLALLGLWVIYKLLKAAIPARELESLEAMTARVAQEAAVAGGPAVPIPDEEVGRMKSGIKDMIGRNPRGVAVILKRWLAGR